MSSTKKSYKPSRIGRNPKEDYSLKGSIWVEKDGELYIGGGRIILLENIERLGSISAAARSMGLGYRNAWLWISSMNKLAPSPLVVKAKGGARGGHAELTEEGRKAITIYRKLYTQLDALLKDHSCLLTDGHKP